MAAELAQQEHPSPHELFSTVEEMIIMDGTTVISVDDADAHYARTAAAGANIVCEPVNRPYGVREYGASDPAAQIWWFKSPLG